MRATGVVDAAGGGTRGVARAGGGTVAGAPVRDKLLITEPGQISPADPIVRVIDAAVYLRPARGGLMLGGVERDPLPPHVWEPPPAVPLHLAGARPLGGPGRREGAGRGAAAAPHRGGLVT